MIQLPQDFKEFIELLNANSVDYMIVGGYAVAYHGAPRYTGDIDLLVKPTNQNGSKVLSALKEFGFADNSLTAAD
jgi:hypothetical protein